MNEKILLLKGSPRRGGNSDIMAEAFKKGAESKGYSVKEIITYPLNVGCYGCESCYKKEDIPCSRYPDFNTFAPDILHAEGIVFAIPLYWFGLPAGFKKFIDNFFCFYVGGKEFKVKRSAMLCCGEADEYNMFDSVQRNIELISGFLGWSLKGQIYVPGVYNAGDIKGNPKLLECEKLGRNFFEGI